MASICATLKAGKDMSCTTPARRYAQKAVLINFDDIDRDTVVYPDLTAEVCAYTVEFSLLEGKTGYAIIGSEKGSAFFGTTANSTSDLGYPQEIHTVQILLTGVDSATKCILDSLSRGRFVAALKFSDDTIEIYGMQSGLTRGDGTYDVQGGGGGSLITLVSQETAPENYLPLVYVSATPGSEVADFDAEFANEAPSV